jgi:GT2 family glycosyltransferase
MAVLSYYQNMKTFQKKNNNLAVGIVSRGRFEETRLLLEDISRSEVLPKELIMVESVIDNNSFSFEIIGKIFRGKNIRIRYKSVNFSNIPRSRNLVLEMTTLGWLVFLDNDVRIDPDYLGKVTKKIGIHQKAFGLVGMIRPVNSTYISEYFSFVFCRGYSSHKKDVLIDFYSTMAVALNLKLIKENKFKFDVRLKTGEDTDFFLTAFERGFSLYYCPSLTVRHNFETRDWSKTIAKFYEYGQYFLIIKSKHKETFNVPCFFPKNRFEKLIMPLLVMNYSFRIIRYIPGRFGVIAWLTHLAMMAGVYSTREGKIKLDNLK